jgi:hypothetical protein
MQPDREMAMPTTLPPRNPFRSRAGQTRRDRRTLVGLLLVCAVLTLGVACFSPRTILNATVGARRV